MDVKVQFSYYVNSISQYSPKVDVRVVVILSPLIFDNVQKQKKDAEKEVETQSARETTIITICIDRLMSHCYRTADMHRSRFHESMRETKMTMRHLIILSLLSLNFGNDFAKIPHGSRRFTTHSKEKRLS